MAKESRLPTKPNSHQKSGYKILIQKEGFHSLTRANWEKLKKCDVKLYPSSPKNKNPMRESTFKIGGDVRYRVNTFRVK